MTEPLLLASLFAAAGKGKAACMADSLQVLDPFDGSLVGELPVAATEEIDQAVATAGKAFGAWARTTAVERGTLLAAAADRVAARADELASWTTREMGKPIADARGGVVAGIGTLRQYAQLGPLHRGASLQGGWGSTDLMVFEPRGVVAVITPWNDPVAVPCGLIGAALAVGNTVVFKPSERTPHTGLALAEALSEALPPGVLMVVVGDAGAGAALASSAQVDVVAHVGSTAAGRAIRAATVTNATKLLLENGGNDALVVDSGVDPEWAAAQAALGAFANAGQICVAVERIYVVEDIAEAFLQALVRRAEQLVPGSGMAATTTLGPLVDARHRAAVHAQVADSVARGAQTLTGGQIPEGPGTFYPATVLVGCTEDMAVMREETFGPVAPVCVVPTWDAALVAARASSYGLAASVLTSSMAHAQEAWRVLPVGTVKINAVFGGAPGGSAEPRRSSGTGFGYGPELLDEMTTTKVVHISAPS
jgi:acyl-CoA reductase-like NAD-dependent aldehyde dehydrogenase